MPRLPHACGQWRSESEGAQIGKEKEFTDPLRRWDIRGVWEQQCGFAGVSGGAFPVSEFNNREGPGQRPRGKRAFPAGTTGNHCSGTWPGRGRGVTPLPGDTALCSPKVLWAPGEVTSCRRQRLLIGRPWRMGEERGERRGGGRDAGAASGS